MKTLNFDRTKSLISSFKNVKVLVVGDLILDEFIWGKVSRISPEAPIPVVWVDSETAIPGGSCNVANNIAALGAEVEVVGLIGNDAPGKKLKRLLRKRKIGVSGIWEDKLRPTTIKTRVIAHQQQVVRIDREKIVSIPKESIKRILTYIEKRMRHIDAVCIEDYGKGVITPELVSRIVSLAQKHKKIITVDPKENHLLYYKKVTAITPNHHEASNLANISINDDSSLNKVGSYLLKKLQCEQVLVTRGESGMCLFQKGKKPVKIPTLARDVYDVSGAGDTVIGTYTIALALGASPLEAAHLANCAAGIVVGKVGTATVQRSELLTRVKQILSN